MPYKHSESRRHKFTKAKYKVTNWAQYNAALRRRGDITIWFTEAAINEWRPAQTGARGRPQEYSGHAIETAILIRQVFHLPLRQTEGFMVSLARLMNAAISIPDFSSIRPELNPVEYLWAWLKRHALANFCPDTLTELKNTARNKLRSAQHRSSIIVACWKQAELW